MVALKVIRRGMDTHEVLARSRASASEFTQAGGGRRHDDALKR
jgi:hypothetical protein